MSDLNRSPFKMKTMKLLTTKSNQIQNSPKKLIKEMTTKPKESSFIQNVEKSPIVIGTKTFNTNFKLDKIDSNFPSINVEVCPIEEENLKQSIYKNSDENIKNSKFLFDGRINDPYPEKMKRKILLKMLNTNTNNHKGRASPRCNSPMNNSPLGMINNLSRKKIPTFTSVCNNTQFFNDVTNEISESTKEIKYLSPIEKKLGVESFKTKNINELNTSNKSNNSNNSKNSSKSTKVVKSPKNIINPKTKKLNEILKISKMSQKILNCVNKIKNLIEMTQNIINNKNENNTQDNNSINLDEIFINLDKITEEIMEIHFHYKNQNENSTSEFTIDSNIDPIINSSERREDIYKNFFNICNTYMTEIKFMITQININNIHITNNTIINKIKNTKIENTTQQVINNITNINNNNNNNLNVKVNLNVNHINKKIKKKKVKKRFKKFDDDETNLSETFEGIVMRVPYKNYSVNKPKDSNLDCRTFTEMTPEMRDEEYYSDEIKHNFNEMKIDKNKKLCLMRSKSLLVVNNNRNLNQNISTLFNFKENSESLVKILFN